MAGAVDEPRRRREDLVARRAAARAAARRARAPSARRRRARGARRRGRRWRCGDRAAGVRVGVDGRSLVGGGARGVAHYTAALLEALASAFPDDEYRVLLPRGDATVPAGGPPSATRCPRGCCSAPRRWRAGPRLDALLGGCDVVWAPAPAPLARRRDAPFVLTVHDRSWEERPQDFTRYERLWHAAARPRRLARRAARVLCDTEVGARRADPRSGASTRAACGPCRSRRARLAGARRPVRRTPTSSRSARSSRARRRTCSWRASGSPASAGSRRSWSWPGDGRRQRRGARRAAARARRGPRLALRGRARGRAPVVARGLRPDAGRGHRRRHARDRQRPPRAARGARRRRALRARRATRPGSPTRCCASRPTRPCASGCWRPAARRSRRSAGPRPRGARARCWPRRAGA